MRPYVQSLGFALNGLRHAFATERNLKLFGALYVLSWIIAAALKINRFEWTLVIFSGAVFLAIELINTALEHFSDAFDDHSKAQDDIHEHAIRATKDIAAGGSLVVAVAWGMTLLLTYWPHIERLFYR